MGLYIRDMEMPQNCDECPLNSTCGYSLHMPLYHTEKRHDDCPLIEVPEPHGRLGDLDAAEALLQETLGVIPLPLYKILKSNTVIPASEEG